jgi:hypothetical protein
MVTVAVPVDVLRVPGVQVVPVPETQLPLFEMYTAGSPEAVDPAVAPPAVVPPAEVPPPLEPPLAAPPVPVLPPVPPEVPPLLSVLPPESPVVPPLLVFPPVLPALPPVAPPVVPDLPPVDPPELLDELLELFDEPPLELLDPPLELLELLDDEAPPELPLEDLLLPPEPPCGELELPPELQAATRNPRQMPVIDMCDLFIANLSASVRTIVAPRPCDLVHFAALFASQGVRRFSAQSREHAILFKQSHSLTIAPTSSTISFVQGWTFRANLFQHNGL